MSNTDSFIEEVSEEVKKDQLYAIYKKYGWIAGLLIVVIVGGAAYSEWSKAKTRQLAQSRGDAISQALDVEDINAQVGALSALSSGAGDAEKIVNLQRAALLADAGKTEEALKIYSALSSSDQTPPIYRDLAALKSVILRGQDMDNAERIAALEDLARAGAPFRPLAMEQLALAQVDADQTDAAVKTLQDLMLEPQVTSAMMQRAQQTIIALGGELPDIAGLLSSRLQSE